MSIERMGAMNYHGRREICANCKHMNRERFPKCVCECRLSRSYKQEVFMGESCGRWREKVPDVIGVSALYREILKVTNSDERGHWYSDLYCKRKPETTRLLDKYQFRSQVSTFTDRITGKLWYCIPFAYNPYWEVKTHADV